jgi:8-oxo-dGTP diphosphatase
MNKTYYIFRHGETFATKKKCWYGTKLYSAPILEEGKPSILRLADYLKKYESDYNVCSPFLRCQQTVAIVSEITGKKFESDKRLREFAFEFPWDFTKRILRFIKEMEESKYETIVICTHAAVLSVLIQYLTKGNINLLERVIAPLPGVLTIIKDKKLEEVNFNK